MEEIRKQADDVPNLTWISLLWFIGPWYLLIHENYEEKQLLNDVIIYPLILNKVRGTISGKILHDINAIQSTENRGVCQGT